MDNLEIDYKKAFQMNVNLLMFTLLCTISIQTLKFFSKDRRLLFYMSRT